MDEDAYVSLLEVLRPQITKKNTRLRNAISADVRLTLFLRYIAFGKLEYDL